MGKKYTKEEIIFALHSKGLTILGEVKTSGDKVHCKTAEGYDVLALPSSIMRRNDTPEPFAKYNPYTLSNIRKWLVLNDIPLELISEEYKGATEKMLWKCSCGEEFETTWAIILGGKKQCNFCAHSKHFDGFRDYYGIIKEECDRCGYDLLTTDINRFTDRFEYICKKHSQYGVQHSNYDNFISSGKHCNYCGIESRGLKNRTDVSEIEKIVTEKGYIFCGVEYDDFGTDTPRRAKVLVKCKHHIDKGVQIMRLNNIKGGNGKCKYCFGREKSQEDLQKEIDDQNLNVTILKYTKYNEPIFVRCNDCGYEWYTKGSYLHSGAGCPNCPKSQFEKNVQSVLDKHNFKYIPQYKFQDCRDVNPLPFDFYLSELNILIEVDGEGHYMPIPRSSKMTMQDAEKNLEITKAHDEIKTAYCNSNNIKLLWIPYWERNNFEEYVLSNINT